MGYRWSIHGSICFISTERFIIWQHSLSLQGEYFWATLELWARFNISVLKFFFLISNKIYWRENTKYTRCILGERIQIKLWKNRIQEVKQIRERIQFFRGHLVKQRAIKLQLQLKNTLFTSLKSLRFVLQPKIPHQTSRVLPSKVERSPTEAFLNPTTLGLQQIAWPRSSLAKEHSIRELLLKGGCF